MSGGKKNRAPKMQAAYLLQSPYILPCKFRPKRWFNSGNIWIFFLLYSLTWDNMMDSGFHSGSWFPSGSGCLFQSCSKRHLWSQSRSRSWSRSRSPFGKWSANFNFILIKFKAYLIYGVYFFVINRSVKSFLINLTETKYFEFQIYARDFIQGCQEMGT